ncbi:MAG: BamA/TamA family outer membrane protein [Proteobacteria bacterium]|nr:BamA/TamA family outer membrane protein [Pseudomonadota bacterium]
MLRIPFTWILVAIFMLGPSLAGAFSFGVGEKDHTPIYELEPDRAKLKAERQRLRKERKELKKKKKALNKARCDLKKKKRKLDKRLKQQKKREADGKLGQEPSADDIRARRNAVEKELSKTEVDRKQVKEELKENFDYIQETKNFLITPFAAPSYTPEMGFLVTGGALMSWKTKRLEPNLQRSSLLIFAGYSHTGTTIVATRFVSFWLKDWLRVNQMLWFKDIPDNYWGVGYEAGSEPAEPNSHTNYHRRWWDLRLEFLGKMWIDDLYGGLVMNFNQTVAVDEADTMVGKDEDKVPPDPYYKNYGANNYNGGLGFRVNYDTRDVVVNAFSGFYVGAEAVFYGPYLGGKNTYQILDLDYRQYITLGRKGSTLAWRIASRIGFGDVPWGELSMAGNPFDLRGYRWGRFRDKTSLLGILEYRIQFKRIRRKPHQSALSPHGIVYWAGAGAVAETYAGMTRWLPNTGIGYRFELQPRMNVRLDFGVGRDTQAVYFNFLESF